MNSPVLKIFSAVIPTIFDSFLRVNRFCAKFLSDQEKANYQQKPVKDKSNDGDMERDDIAEDHS